MWQVEWNNGTVPRGAGRETAVVDADRECQYVQPLNVSWLPQTTDTLAKTNMNKDQETSLSQPSHPLTGQVALVTGGGRGIGRSIAVAYAQAGADVCVMARTTGEIQAVAKEITGMGRKAIALTADVTDRSAVEQAVTEFSENFERLDILVNNAGGATDRSGFLESSVEDWVSAVRLNIEGVYLVSRFFTPLMIQSGGGKIINVGSGMGHRAGDSNSSYRVGKAGAWMLTQCMSEELWGHGIEVNELVPGPVATDATKGIMKIGGPPPFAPSERVKSPDEVAPMALWLVTQLAGGPTGQSFSLARRPI